MFQAKPKEHKRLKCFFKKVEILKGNEKFPLEGVIVMIKTKGLFGRQTRRKKVSHSTKKYLLRSEKNWG